MMDLTSSSRPALTIEPTGETLSFTELNQAVNKFAWLLRSRGLQPGDRVAILLGNQLEYPITVLGAQAGGFDHLLLNVHAPVSEIVEVLNRFDPAAVITSDELSELATQVVNGMSPQLVRIMIGAKLPGWICYQDQMGIQPDCLCSSITPGKLLLLSGGSTGVSKIVRRPDDDVQQVVTIADLPDHSDPVLLVSAPLYHTSPIYWTLGGLERGAHVIIMRQWDSCGVLAAIARHRVTWLPLVPTMMQRLLELPESLRASYDVTSLTAVSQSAAPCSNEVKRSFLRWIPCLWTGYSMSEGFGRTSITPEEWLTYPGSVGKAAPWCRIVIRNDEGEEVVTGEVGIVWFARQDGKRMSYMQQPAETAGCYNVHGEGSAFDLGYLNEKGYLFLTGRQKNMIIVGGVNVFPASVEAALRSHPGVAEVHVQGQRHRDLGEVPVAVVEPCGEYPGNLEADLVAWCRKCMGGASRPRKIVVVKSLPRLPTGKLDRAAIEALLD